MIDNYCQKSALAGQHYSTPQIQKSVNLFFFEYAFLFVCGRPG
jgi:hypothetical protein